MKATGSLLTWCVMILLIAQTGWNRMGMPLFEPGEIWLMTAGGIPGTDPTIIRWMSMLLLLLALALLWRAARDRHSGSENGLALLALSGLWLDHSLQATGYAAGLLAVAGIWLAVERGLNQKFVWLYGMCLLLAALFLPLALLLIPGLMAFRLIRRQWQPALILGAGGLAAGLLAGALWLNRPDLPWWLLISESGIRIEPAAMVALLLLLGLAAGAGTLLPDRSRAKDSLWAWGGALVLTCLFLMPVGWFTVALLALPFATLAAGRALQALIWPARGLFVLFMGVLLLMTPRPVSPYLQLSMQLVPDPGARTGIILSAPDLWQHSLMTAYLPYDEADSFHLLAPTDPAPFVHAAQVEADLTGLEPWSEAYDQLWVVKDGGVVLEESAKNWLRQDYVATASLTWDGYPPLPDEGRLVTGYRRIPSDLADLYRFGDAFQLAAWRYRDDVRVRPCQTIRLESWWRLLQPVSSNYTLTLVLADGQGQGIVRNDSAPGGIDTLLWQMDQPYVDVRVLTLPCDLPAGEYPLLLGLYGVMDGRPEPLGTPFYLTTLFVEAP